MVEQKLKDCPFCGFLARRYVFESCGDIRYMTFCASGSSSEACAGASTASKETQDKADESWNRRAE